MTAKQRQKYNLNSSEMIFFYDALNDAVSNSDYTALSEMTAKQRRKRTEKEAVVV